MKAGLQQIDLILVMNVETLLACCGKLRVEIKQKKNKKQIKNLLIQSRCSFNYSAAISSIQFNFIYTTALTIRTVSARAIQAKLGPVEELNLSIKYYRKK